MQCTAAQEIDYWTWIRIKWRWWASSGLLVAIQAAGTVVDRLGLVSKETTYFGVDVAKVLPLALHLFQLAVITLLLAILYAAPAPLTSRAYRTANIGVREFYTRWKWVWMLWALLYTFFSLKDWFAYHNELAQGRGIWVWAVLDLLNMIQSVVIFHSYFGLFRQQRKINFLWFGIVLALVLSLGEWAVMKHELDASLLAPAGSAKEGAVVVGDKLEMDRSVAAPQGNTAVTAGAPSQTSRGFVFWFRIAVGILGGLALISLTERLASGFMTTPRIVVGCLYAYGMIQGPWTDFSDNPGLELAMTSVALGFKVLLFSVVYWVTSSGLLLFYLVKIQEFDGRAPNGEFRGLLGIDALRLKFISSVRAENEPSVPKAQTEEVKGQ
jgi:hypothetical protein